MSAEDDRDAAWRAFWTPRRRFWRILHGVANDLAQSRRVPGWPPASRHWLWRLNDWLAAKWTHDYIAWRAEETAKGRSTARKDPRA